MFPASAVSFQPPTGGFRLSSGLILPTTSVFEMYWYFAAERQEIFFRRLNGEPPPWTQDPILRAYRFTNVYRASDRVSQFLIRNVIYAGEQSNAEIFFRTLLFKLFNRIETWRLLQQEFGIPTWRSFDIDAYTKVLDRASAKGQKLYSAAYIIPSPNFGSPRKHVNHLKLLHAMMHDDAPDKVSRARSLHEVYAILRSYPSIGDFLGFQFAVDLNYSNIVDFSEMEYVVAGPGARSGIHKSFADLHGITYEDLIVEVTKAAEREFASRGLKFRTLFGRPLHLIDCQNLFCEIDKYARVALPPVEAPSARTRIKRRFQASSERDAQWFPPKWNLIADSTNREVPTKRRHHAS